MPGLAKGGGLPVGEGDAMATSGVEAHTVDPAAIHTSAGAKTARRRASRVAIVHLEARRAPPRGPNRPVSRREG